MKKVVDILPPKKIEEKEKILEKKKPEFKISLPKFQLPKAQPKKVWILVFFFFFILVFFLVSLKFSKAEIKIWPETEELIFKEKLTIDTEIETPDFKQKVIPGKIFEAEETFAEEFPASGKVLKKAEGIIRLFNAYTTQPEVWLKGTRFVSSEGKLFKSKDKIYVPGAEIKDGKIQPSFVDVPVVAAEGGSEYNIGPSNFSIVVYKGTPRYFKFYGQSFQPMTGGGEISQVKKEDLEKAEETLLKKAEIEGKEILKNRIPAEFIFSEKILETKILEKFSSAKEGAEVEKFNFQIKAKFKSIVFLKEDLSNFAKEYILSKIPTDKKLYLESLKTEYSPEAQNFELGKVSLSLNFSAKIYPEIDSIFIKKGLVGRSLKEAEFFLTNQPQFLKAEIHLFPFWLRKIPEDINKIEIKYPLID